MAKRLLHQLRVRTANPSGKRAKRKLVIRPLAEASHTMIDDELPLQPSPTDPTTDEEQKRPKTQSSRWRRFWRWSLVWLSAILILGGTGIVGALLLTTPPPPPDCDRMSPLAPDSERLYCAQQAAQSGKLEQLVAAMTLVSRWGEGHPLYPEAQRKMEEWSQAILAIARKKMNQGNLAGAIAIVRKIPVDSPFYPEAQAKITDWQQDWNRGEKIAASVEDALKAQNWIAAAKKAQDLEQVNIDYWSQQRLDKFMKQIEIEKQALQQLQEARSLAASNSPISLDQAIALAGKVDPKSFARAQALALRDQWSHALVQIAASRFKQEDYAGVVVMLQRIPTESSVYEEAQDWIRLSRAQYAVGQDNILGFMDALFAVGQIGQKSPLYPQAQARKALWQSRLQNHLQLEFASTLASFNQPLTFQLAIDQASSIDPNRPERIAAQTLIAHWQREIQQISNRSALFEARQLAQPGTIESLKAAVAKAEQVQLGQPLRVEAQTAIAQWTGQIQTIEDKPVLDMAQSYAQKGDLIAAVQTARKIHAGRALYPQARDAVYGWVAQIQIAEDRPILRAATDLAEQGQLAAAIQTAAQIGAGRPLYKKAQTAIATWQSKLDAAQAEQQQTEPVGAQPVRTEPVQAQPVRTEPVQTEPVRTEPVRTEPVQTESVRSKRSQTSEQAEREQVDRERSERQRARAAHRKRRLKSREEPSVDTD